MRQLERQAATGDTVAQKHLNLARLREGQITQLEFDMERAAMGDHDAINLLLENEDIHPSLICRDVFWPKWKTPESEEPKLRRKGCNRLMQPIPEHKHMWGITYRCSGCGDMYKVHCGQRMATHGRSRFGPGQIECRVCDYEKDFN
jgi:hypothetical protein